MRQIVLDTETTGRSKSENRIIEIGAIEMIDRVQTGKHYHVYLNPQQAVEQGALAVHGLTNAFLADKPLFADVVEALMAFIDGAELIIHNAPFDVGFIEAELARVGHAIQRLEDCCTIIDTLPMARQKHPGQRNSLDALCKRYEVDNSDRALHGALLDSHLLALVYLRMTGGQNSLFASTAPTTTMAQVVGSQVVMRRIWPD
jgi:DNA polymerase-3 subunit epsilon